jgi:hypothetical protein
MQIHYQLATAKKGSLSITKYFQSFKAMCETLLLPSTISMTLKVSPIFLLASDPIMIRLLPQSLLGWILSLPK